MLKTPQFVCKRDRKWGRMQLVLLCPDASNGLGFNLSRGLRAREFDSAKASDHSPNA